MPEYEVQVCLITERVVSIWVAAETPGEAADLAARRARARHPDARVTSASVLIPNRLPRP